jgi:hypothetical protein
MEIQEEVGERVFRFRGFGRDGEIDVLDLVLGVLRKRVRVGFGYDPIIL